MADAIAQILHELEEFRDPKSGLSGNPLRLTCSVTEPASSEEIAAAWCGREVPSDALALWSVSREARLFEDVDYGQWGLVLLPPSDALSLTRELREQRPQDTSDEDVVIGEFLGDSEFLVLGSLQGCRQVLVALPLDERESWYQVAPSLDQFLRRYLEARGAKYWERTPGNAPRS